jgi:organic hydroperoxide reductase OsmC/OhrA
VHYDRGVTVHRYEARVAWRGDTGAGYDAYDRAHDAAAPPADAALGLSADPAFLGSSERLNPEQLLLMSASSCQLLSFLARAARMRLQVLGYEDEAEASMDMDDPPARINRIVLRPRITVAAGCDEAKVRKAVDGAHRDCFVANALSCEMVIEPTVLAGQAV